MIRIAVVDSTAESRNRMIDQLESNLSSNLREISLIPRVSFRPVSPQELRFQAAPEVCVVGPELIAVDLMEVGKIKKILPQTPLVVWVNPGQNSLSVIEQLARQGADDVVSTDAAPTEFFRRLVLLCRRSARHSSGKLILVDGGKGGVGVSTVAAAIAERATIAGKRTVLIDCDFETQDLSRFLQARPFVNENLRLILDNERAVSDESVEQCLSRVWQDDDRLLCVPPVADADDLYDPLSTLPRTFLSVLEVLDARYDLVIVDLGCARSVLQKVLYKVADRLVFVISDDPASLYASVEKLTRIRTLLSSGTPLLVIENSVGLSGLGNKLLRKEFSRAARLEEKHWAPEAIGYCKLGQRWPGSGGTFFSQARSACARSIDKLAQTLEIFPGEASSERASLFRFVRQMKGVSGRLAQTSVTVSGAGQSVPMLPVQTVSRISSDAVPELKLLGHARAIDQASGEEEFDINSLVSAAGPR